MTNEVPAKRGRSTQGNWRITTEESSSAHDRRERPSDLLTRDDIPSIVKAVLDSLPSRNAGTLASTNAADPTHATEAADVGHDQEPGKRLCYWL